MINISCSELLKWEDVLPFMFYIILPWVLDYWPDKTFENVPSSSQNMWHLLFFDNLQFLITLLRMPENYFSNIVSNNPRNCTTNNIVILVLTVPIFSHLTLFHSISLEEITSLVRYMKTSQAPLNTAFLKKCQRVLSVTNNSLTSIPDYYL